jgi:outer membrane protein TolC
VRRGLAILLLLAGAGRAQASRWALAELVKKAQTDFPTVTAARHAVESAEEGLRAAQFAWLPTGDATLFLSGSPKVQCLPGVPAGTTDPATLNALNTPNPNQLVRESNCVRTTVVSLDNTPNASLLDTAPIHGLFLRLDVTLAQSLYSFGRTESQIAAARALVDTAKANLSAAEADAALNANRAYWGLKAARAAVEALTEAIDKLKEWVAKIDAQLNGKNDSHYTEADLARMKIALAFANTQLFDQQRNMSYAKEALGFLTGDSAADVDESELELNDEPDPLPIWQALAERRRPEIVLLRANDAWAASQRKARLADLLPELSFVSTLSVGYSSSTDTPQNYYLNRPNFTNVTLGLQLHLPLDFGPRAARFLQARQDLRATNARSRGTLITYSQEIAKAYEDYNEARSRAKEVARGEKVSRGWYFAVDSNVSSGLADSREMVEVLQSYFTFRLRSFQAIYDANTALAWLRRATGAVATVKTETAP